VDALGGPISLSTATEEELARLNGIGPGLAHRIVQWRAAHGPFWSVDQLGEISGIGEAKLEAIRPYVTAGPRTSPFTHRRPADGPWDPSEPLVLTAFAIDEAERPDPRYLPVVHHNGTGRAPSRLTDGNLVPWALVTAAVLVQILVIAMIVRAA
jgi:competence ComEA-like helix-hairpin-helix protein